MSRMSDATDKARTLAKELTDVVGVSVSFACELARNKRKPSLELAVKIEDALGIPPRWWIKREEVAGE